MEKILFITAVEQDGSLSRNSLETLTAAAALAAEFSADLTAGLIGKDVQTAADAIAGSQASTFYGVSGDDFAQPRYATDAAACEAIIKASEATLVLAPASSRMNRVLPGVAQRLEGRADTNATGVTSDGETPLVARWFYRQRMKGLLARSERPWIVTFAPGCCTATAFESGSAQVQDVTPSLDDSARRTTFVSVETPDEDQKTIRPDAELLLVAGAGWTKKQADGQTHLDQAEDRILSFLEATKASLGSSKSLVDLSGEGQAVLPFLTHLHQVGQTGSTPRHPKGLATCCHGEEPHVVGWRFINERRAVNLDAGCGWAQGKADVLYVADAFEVMAKVNELLKG